MAPVFGDACFVPVSPVLGGWVLPLERHSAAGMQAETRGGTQVLPLCRRRLMWQGDAAHLIRSCIEGRAPRTQRLSVKSCGSNTVPSLRPNFWLTLRFGARHDRCCPTFCYLVKVKCLPPARVFACCRDESPFCTSALGNGLCYKPRRTGSRAQWHATRASGQLGFKMGVCSHP